MENQIVVNDYRQMDKILKEERTYLLNLVKKIKKAKCNVLLIQKSILRDAVNDLSLHFLAKLNILAIKDIERDEVEFICKVNLWSMNRSRNSLNELILTPSTNSPPAANRSPISITLPKTSSVPRISSRKSRRPAHAR